MLLELIVVGVALLIGSWRLAQQTDDQRARRQEALENLRFVRDMVARGEIDQTSFSGMYLRGMSLAGLDLGQADFYGADLRDADLSEAYLGFANLWNADLRGANLYGADLEAARLSGANMQRANVSSTNLDFAWLSGTDLREATFSDFSDFCQAGPGHFQRTTVFLPECGDGGGGGTSLRGLDLSSARLDGADLSHVCFDAETKWPADFSVDTIPLRPGCNR